MARFSEEFKYSIVKRMMPPTNESVNLLAKETGLAEATLYNWKKNAKSKGMAVPGGQTESERWSTQDKFSIVVETATLSEIELAEYCRSKGLYVEQIQAWRDACMQANGGVAEQANGGVAEQANGGVAEQANQLQKNNREKDRQIKKLSQELRRKEAALAETAALLVLRKKASAIWGDNEDD